MQKKEEVNKTIRSNGNGTKCVWKTEVAAEGQEWVEKAFKLSFYLVRVSFFYLDFFKLRQALRPLYVCYSFFLLLLSDEFQLEVLATLGFTFCHFSTFFYSKMYSKAYTTRIHSKHITCIHLNCISFNSTECVLFGRFFSIRFFFGHFICYSLVRFCSLYLFFARWPAATSACW